MTNDWTRTRRRVLAFFSPPSFRPSSSFAAHGSPYIAEPPGGPGGGGAGSYAFAPWGIQGVAVERRAD